MLVTVFVFDVHGPTHIDHPATAVKPVGGHVVAKMRLSRDRIHRQRLRAKRIVRAAHAAARGRFATLWTAMSVTPKTHDSNRDGVA